uniref:Uncharacterized protein n=1 Tax=Mola mola TaxID=94237 RepID=A0A3Q4AUI0_MOLML
MALQSHLFLLLAPHPPSLLFLCFLLYISFLSYGWRSARPTAAADPQRSLTHTTHLSLPIILTYPFSLNECVHLIRDVVLCSGTQHKYPQRSMSKMRPLNCPGGHANCNRCLKTPKPVPIFLIPQPFPWCLQNDGEMSVGQSDCLRTFKWDPQHTNVYLKPLDSAPEHCVAAAGKMRLSALAHRTASCSISSPTGMYWVCGNLAYPYLPVDYKGRCGLAYVVPAMRVAHSLPQKPPAKRTRRGASDIFGTHYQSPFKNVVGTLLPFYGIMSALDQIADLSHVIEVIANETGKALTLISSELASVRLLALQNRAALDFLLAAQGGTCAVIGSECCTFVPEYNATIHEIVTHLHETAHSLHQDSSSLSDWLSTAFRSLGYPMFEALLILVVFIVLLSLFISCVKKFVFNLIRGTKVCSWETYVGFIIISAIKKVCKCGTLCLGTTELLCLCNTRDIDDKNIINHNSTQI